ncbi:MAG: ABC-F family ATP-binding cassette domain-containing protein [Candidatus Eremiobacteraeota bacterium]|nr:ABC-F family ATP-binding cassette domain-containing protein [Candidatus Eremiobacteraeota bacterium]
MELLRFSDLECHYGAREIFSGLNGVLAEGERVGLVGPNGAGKSSLLRLLAGVDTPFGGTIVRARGVRFGYLAQSVADETTATLTQLVDAALDRAPVEERGLRNKTLRIMFAAFGFTEDDLGRSLRTFSGGQRAKAALAHVLIDDPDYCILDEPTNHLDISTVRWLESYIASDKRAYLIVSHDRYFLDRVASRIWELDRGALQIYPPATPAYAAFVEAREERRARERRDYDAYIAERDKARATVAGLRATLTSSNYSRVRSREKQLARMESQEVAAPPAARRAISVGLTASRRSGNGFAFEAQALTKRYDRTLFENLTIDVEGGERIAVVGANGSGKSTFLKILTGGIAPDGGAVRFNPASAVASFAQNAHEELDGAQSAVEAVMRAGDVGDERARGLLGRMRISGDDGDKPIHAFSGGERRRIMLACLMARAADILLLDEPTNDLDVESQEALESVLGEYEGTIVAVSHDRYFLNALCDRVLWIEDGSWGVLEGGYEAYEAQIRERERVHLEARATPRREKTSSLTPLKVRSKLETQIARLEREIEKLDARKAEIDASFADPTLYEDRARVKELEAEREGVTARSAQAVTEWEARLLELEELG